MSARKGRQQEAFADSSSVSTFPPGRLGLADRRKSPAVVANIPIFERPRLETRFDRDCPVRAENLVGFISTSRQADKVLQASSQAIHRPCRDHVDLAHLAPCPDRDPRRITFAVLTH